MFVLLEAFKDDAAQAHVSSEHFKAGLESMACCWSRPRRSSLARWMARTGDQMGELQIED